MQQLPATEAKSLRDSFREFLNLQRRAKPTPQHCEHCGSLYVYLSARFWLDDGEEFWDIPLPVCFACHPELCERNAAVA
jgi:hypothetical protein